MAIRSEGEEDNSDGYTMYYDSDLASPTVRAVSNMIFSKSLPLHENARQPRDAHDSSTAFQILCGRHDQ